jgi:predicted ester cyclase
MAGDEQSNIRKVEAFFAAIDAGDLDTLFTLLTDPFENHGVLRPRAALAMVVDDIRTRAPDIHTSIDHFLAAGNEVVTRNTYSGTHLGIGKYPVDGGQLVGVPPTGRPFSVAHIHWFTFRDGLICAHGAVRDDASMLVQLGLLPQPPPFVAPAALSSRTGRMRSWARRQEGE